MSEGGISAFVRKIVGARRGEAAESAAHPEAREVQGADGAGTGSGYANPNSYQIQSAGKDGPGHEAVHVAQGGPAVSPENFDLAAGVDEAAAGDKSSAWVRTSQLPTSGEGGRNDSLHIRPQSDPASPVGRPNGDTFAGANQEGAAGKGEIAGLEPTPDSQDQRFNGVYNITGAQHRYGPEDGGPEGLAASPPPPVPDSSAVPTLLNFDFDGEAPTGAPGLAAGPAAAPAEGEHPDLLWSPTPTSESGHGTEGIAADAPPESAIPRVGWEVAVAHPDDAGRPADEITANASPPSFNAAGPSTLADLGGPEPATPPGQGDTATHEVGHWMGLWQKTEHYTVQVGQHERSGPGSPGGPEDLAAADGGPVDAATPKLYEAMSKGTQVPSSEGPAAGSRAGEGILKSTDGGRTWATAEPAEDAGPFVGRDDGRLQQVPSSPNAADGTPNMLLGGEPPAPADAGPRASGHVKVFDGHSGSAPGGEEDPAKLIGGLRDEGPPGPTEPPAPAGGETAAPGSETRDQLMYTVGQINPEAGSGQEIAAAAAEPVKATPKLYEAAAKGTHLPDSQGSAGEQAAAKVDQIKASDIPNLKPGPAAPDSVIRASGFNVEGARGGGANELASDDTAGAERALQPNQTDTAFVSRLADDDEPPTTLADLQHEGDTGGVDAVKGIGGLALEHGAGELGDKLDDLLD